MLVAVLGKDKTLQPLTLKQGTALGYVCGFVWYLGNCYWIYQTMNLYGGLTKPVAAGILVLFCLYLGLYHALFATVVVTLRRSRLGGQGALLLSPFVWVAVELARARITGLPWDLLGITQVDNPLLIRLAPITGAYGISFVIMAVNALWLVRISVRERRFTRPALTLAGVAIILIYLLALHGLRSPIGSPASATATLVQENLEVGAANTGPEPSEQQMLESFSYLSQHPASKFFVGIPELPGTPTIVMLRGNSLGEGSESKVPSAVATNLIVWPESPAPFEEIDPQFRAAVSALARSTQAPVIVGNIGFERTGGTARGYKMFNSASFVDADGKFVGRYDKMHLVPFGEYVPFKDFLFFAKNLLNEVGTFNAGQERTVFTTGGHGYGTFICYESVFGDEVRQFVERGADVLVNISNDGWYGDTSAAWQHLNMVRMRAIENHRWVLRATNTGVTAAINPNGRVMTAAPRHVRTAIAVRFGYEHDLTFYTVHGDLFAYGCALITLIAFGFSLMRPMQ